MKQQRFEKGKKRRRRKKEFETKEKNQKQEQKKIIKEIDETNENDQKSSNRSQIDQSIENGSDRLKIKPLAKHLARIIPQKKEERRKEKANKKKKNDALGERVTIKLKTRKKTWRNKRQCKHIFAVVIFEQEMGILILTRGWISLP